LHGIGYQRQSWWSQQPVVHIVRRLQPTNSGKAANNAERLPQYFSDWSPRIEDGAPQNVEVFSNCDSVELFLNDKSLGSKPRPDDNASARVWRVPFEKGTLKAVAKNGDKSVATQELRTAGKPAKVLVTVDRRQLPNDFDDVAMVRASVVDENGTIVPDAAELVTFEITGPGAVVAVDNADMSSHEAFQMNKVKPFAGKCLAIVRSTAADGEMQVKATSPGLDSAGVTITATAANAGCDCEK
jgi:beta-galactosidase